MKVHPELSFKTIIIDHMKGILASEMDDEHEWGLRLGLRAGVRGVRGVRVRVRVPDWRPPLQSGGAVWMRLDGV